MPRDQHTPRTDQPRQAPEQPTGAPWPEHARTWRQQLEFFVRELPSFTYREVHFDEKGHSARTYVVPYRSLVQWLIMLIGETIAILTAGGVFAVVLTFVFGEEHLGFIGTSAKAFTSLAIEKRPEHWTSLGLAMLRLANIGVLVLSANAVLEIGLLIEEPGVKHVRRVLALSFTGMALYLIKEYPIRHEMSEFLVGCLAGALAALLWLLAAIAAKIDPSRRVSSEYD
jgi:hypothetical protein